MIDLGKSPLCEHFLTAEELAVVKRCLRRIYANMKSRPAGAVKDRRAG